MHQLLLSLTDYLLWVTGEILLLVACAAILRRRLVYQFPVFFVYAAFQVLRTAALLTIHVLQLQHRMGYADYFYAYWTSQALSIVLGFAVIREIYCGVFQHYDALRRLGGILFACAGTRCWFWRCGRQRHQAQKRQELSGRCCCWSAAYG